MSLTAHHKQYINAIVILKKLVQSKLTNNDINNNAILAYNRVSTN